MIIQCPRCRALTWVSAIYVQASQAGVHCVDCLHTHWLPVAEPPTTAEAQMTAAERVAQPASERPPPARDASTAASAKGAADWLPQLKAQFTHDETALSETELPLADGFRALLDHWHDEKAHQQLIQRASLSGQLATLGRWYRRVLTLCADEPLAKQAQERILQAALVSLTPAPMTNSSASTVKRVLVAGILCLSVGFLGWSVWHLQELLHGP